MTGLIFATRREAEPLLQSFTTRAVDGTELPLLELVGSDGQVTALLVIAGIGPAAGARAAQYLVETRQVRRIVNAGICGAASDAVAVGTVLRVDQARLEEEGQPTPCATSAWTDLPGARLTTCQQPVFDAERRLEIRAWGELVDMEGAAIAKVCHQHGIPAHLVKGVSDRADAAGKRAVEENIDIVSRRVAEVVAEGLPGLVRQRSARSDLVAKMLRFVKIEHTIFSLPLLLAGAWLGAGHSLPSWTTILLIIVAGTGARTVGMAMNRIADRRLDALNPRTANRELPMQTLTVANAWVVAAAGLLLYLGACILLGRLCVLLAPVPLLPLILYSYLKRFTSLCHFGIGICLGLAPLGAFVAAAGHLRFDLPVLLLALFSFAWISGFDIIYAQLDRESDLKNGVCSLPAVLGAGRAELVSILVHIVALSAAAGMLVLTGGEVLAWGALGVTAGALLMAHLPLLPLPARFFPLSAVAGVSAALVPVLGAFG
jgi:4-hydroxybenzoate polyprenyltransferase